MASARRHVFFVPLQDSANFSPNPRQWHQFDSCPIASLHPDFDQSPASLLVLSAVNHIDSHFFYLYSAAHLTGFHQNIPTPKQIIFVLSSFLDFSLEDLFTACPLVVKWNTFALFQFETRRGTFLSLHMLFISVTQ